MNIILFNPLSNNTKSKKTLYKFTKKLKKEEYKVVDITTMNIKDIDYKEDDTFTFIGGDGTLHTLINIFKDNNITNKVFYYKGGSANDFARDFKEKYIDITPFIKHVPKSNDKYYLTSTGFGLDAQVCDNVNNDSKSNYYKVTINTMKNFERFDLKLIADGKEYDFKNVWFASVMNGRCIGGGMKLSPKSNRLDDDLEVYVVHSLGLFKLLNIFPTIFLGIHGMFKKNIFKLKAKDVKLISSSPQVMHSDGEVYGRVDTIEVKF